MDNYIWVFQKKDDRNLVWAFACSLAVHFMLLAILVIKPFYPIAGSTEKLDSIWLYPALTAPGDSMPKVNASPRIAGPAPEDGGKAPGKEAAAQSMEGKKTIVAEKHEQPEDNKIAQEEPTSDSNIRTEPVTEMVAAKVNKIKAGKSLEKENEEKKPVSTRSAERLMDDHSGTSVSQRKIPRAASIEEKDSENRTEASKPVNSSKEEIARKLDADTEREKLLTSSEKAGIKSPEAAGPIQNAATSAGKPAMQSGPNSNADIRQIPRRNSIVVDVSGQSGGKRDSNVASDKKVAGNSLLPIRIAAESPSRPAGMGSLGKSSDQEPLKPASEPSQIRGTGQPGGKESRDKPTPVAALPKSKIEENAKNPVNQQKKGASTADNGIALLPLTGDLKLEVTGDTGLVFAVSFKGYLKSRRDRPMTRAEARHVQTVKPVTRTVGKVVEAVVGTTGEGVYEFIVRPAGANAVTAVFKVKIYENRSKAKTRSLGAKTVKERTIIARILMPEGIFWDDDGYFSGNLEDSESITKYNSDTGLVWKEYKSPGE